MTLSIASSIGCSVCERSDAWCLADIVAAADFTLRAVETIRRVQGAVDVEAVFSAMVDATLTLGADQSVFVSYLRDDRVGESLRFLVAGDPSWCLHYRQHGWFMDDAWLLHAMGNSEPVTDRQISYRTAHQRRLREIASAHGVASAYIVPAPASSGLTRLGVLLLASSQPGYFEGGGVDVLKILARSLAMELHAWWVRCVRQEIIASHRLAAIDLLLLRREKDGKLTKQIAAEFDLTEASVNSRFQRLNAKFNTPNRKVTARVASEYGLI
jgi:DNA-binding CsgD family transcriptional regulator